MHFLIVTHYYDPNEGEAAKRLTQQAQAMVSHGHQVTVITTMPHYPKGKIDDAYRGHVAKVEMRDGVRVIYTWLWATPSPKISRKLISQLTFMITASLRGIAIPKPDAVLIEAQPIFTGLAGRFIARLKGAPYVLNVSDLWPDHLLSVGALTEDSRIYKIARYAMDSGYRGASAITTMSPAWSRKIVDYLKGQNSDKVITILRGADTDRFKPDVDASQFLSRFNLPADKKLVTFLGTFSTPYDFEAMFDVISLIDKRSDCHTVIIGTGSQREYVLKRINEDKFENLTYVDWLPHTEIAPAWAASYLCFWALRDESLYYGTIPAKIFEAYAAGVPVAVANGGECAAIVKESQGGIAVKPGDTAGLIDAVNRLLDQPDLRAEMSANARAYALEKFSFPAAARHYEQVLTDAASRS